MHSSRGGMCGNYEAFITVIFNLFWLAALQKIFSICRGTSIDASIDLAIFDILIKLQNMQAIQNVLKTFAAHLQKFSGSQVII